MKLHSSVLSIYMSHNVHIVSNEKIPPITSQKSIAKDHPIKLLFIIILRNCAVVANIYVSVRQISYKFDESRFHMATAFYGFACLVSNNIWFAGSSPGRIGWNVPPSSNNKAPGTSNVKPPVSEQASKTSATNVQSGYPSANNPPPYSPSGILIILPYFKIKGTETNVISIDLNFDDTLENKIPMSFCICNLGDQLLKLYLSKVSF